MLHFKPLFALFVASLAPVLTAAEELTIVGTGSGVEVIAAVGQSFSQAHPGVTIRLPESIGSGGAIKAVGNGQAVLGRVARNLKDSEKSLGLTYAPVAKLPIVFIVNKGIALNRLTPAAVCDIYSGKVANWKEVGGPDLPIRVIRREDGDSSLEVLLKTFPGFKDITITSRSKTTLSDPSTIELVEKTAGTIAFGTYPNAKAADVTIVNAGEADPSRADYPYTGTLALVFKADAKTGTVGQFVDFATSAAAAESIRKAGGL